MAYNFCEFQKKYPWKNMFTYSLRKIIARYISSFFVLMLIAIAVGILINDASQFLLHEDIEGNCKKFRWRNLLFIQNFFPLAEMCMIWSW